MTFMCSMRRILFDKNIQGMRYTNKGNHYSMTLTVKNEWMNEITEMPTDKE